MNARQWLASHRTRYARLRAELARVRAVLDALDRGVIEAGLIAAQAVERLDAQDEAWSLWRVMHGRVREQAADQPAPEGEGDLREILRMPSGHPESPAALLSDTDEGMLAVLCTELWPRDEYTQITADSHRERWGEGPAS
jgi:hypothetical protein